MVHNIVWSAETYEAMLESLDTGTLPDPDPATHRCETLDGVPLDPTEAIVSSLVCGRHNRHKHNHRFTVERGPDGDYAVTRPDGTLVR